MEMVFNQVLILFVFLVAGWLLKTGGLADAAHTRILSSLEVYVFLPCLYFNNFSKHFTLEYLGQKYPLLLISLGILLVLMVVCRLAAKLFTKQEYERILYEYSLLMPNYGFVGYALCGALFGDMALLDMMLFTIPMAVYVASAGFLRLTRRTGKDFKLRRILTPSMIGILLGCAVGLSGLPMPEVVTSVTNSAKGCMSPVAMLLTGITIAQFPLKELFNDWRNYVVTFVRMVGVPLLLFGILKLLQLDSYLPTVLIVYCMPCGMNTVVYPKLIGENCRIGTSLVLISAVASLITIPLFLQLLA